MLITPANLNLFFTNLNTTFYTAYSTTPIMYDKIATTYPVTTETWASGWIGMLNSMREWNGPRITHQPAPQVYQVPIQNFELTEQIDQFKLEDDTYGIYFPTATFMGEQAKKWPDYQLRDLLENRGSQTGSRQIGIDGLSYFNTAHPVNFYDASMGTYCNDFTGTQTVDGVVVGGGLAYNSFSTVWQTMARYKSESGEPLGLVPNMTVTPAALKFTADTILQAQFMGAPIIGNIGTGVSPNYAQVGSTENMLKGWTDRMMWPDLTDPENWYVMCTNRGIKPFSWLLRRAPDFVYRNNPQDPAVFDAHTYVMGSSARGAPAWAFPWLCARSAP